MFKPGMKCINGYEIEAMQSAAGWYMGTRTEEGFPKCRITTRYYRTPDEAMDNMDADYRVCMENGFCSKGEACYVSES